MTPYQRSELFAFLEACNEASDDLPDGAWEAYIKDNIRWWLKENKAKGHDVHDLFIEFVEASAS